jgi:chromosome segregation ATPase
VAPHTETITRMDRTIASLNATIASLEAQIASLEANISSHEKAIAEQESTIARLEGEISGDQEVIARKDAVMRWHENMSLRYKEANERQEAMLRARDANLELVHKELALFYIDIQKKIATY